MLHAGRDCTSNPPCRMLENVQHLQPQPAGAWHLCIFCHTARIWGSPLSASCSLCGLGDTRSTEEFVSTTASYLMQRSACFFHFRLPVHDSFLTFTAFPFSLHLMSYEKYSFGYFRCILLPEVRGIGFCKFLVLLILFEGMTPQLILKQLP